MAWSRIRGHDAAHRQLLAAYERGRLAHAYLFVGPDGVGKRLFATELAKALLCDRPPAPLTACDRCPTCVQVEAGTHPDFFTAETPEDKLELPIDSMRQFCARFAMKASRGSRKVGVILTADDFNEESANCFLKTLEEPPAGATLILLATSTDQQLATILSRCQVVRFRKVSDDEIRAVLTDQGVTDPPQLERLVRLAAGSPGQALALNDESLWNFRGSLLASLGAPRLDAVGMGGDWMRFIEDAGKESPVQRQRASLMIRLLLDLLQTTLRLALGTTAALDPAESRALQSFAKRSDPDHLANLLEACAEADYLIQRRVQLVLVIESLMDKLCRAPSVTSV